MKQLKLLIGLSLVLALLLAGCSHHLGTVNLSAKSPVLARIQKKGVLVVGTMGGMPPLNMTTKEGRLIGFEIDLARYMADSMGVELRLQKIQFSKLLPSLEAGKIDMILSGMTMTSRRNLRVAFVGPYMVSGKAILTSQATLAAITDPNQVDKNEYKIAALEGSTSQQFVEEVLSRAQLVKTKDYDEAVAMVIKGDVTALLADWPICLVSVARYPEHDLFTIVSPFTYEPIGVALPPDDPLLVNWVDNFLAKLEDSGAMDNLKDYWIDNPQWIEQIK